MIEDGEDYTTWLRRKMYLIIGVAGVGLMILGIAINSIRTQRTMSRGVERSEELGTSTAAAKGRYIKVDIEGAVERPGVYEIPYDSRTQDVLITAGGLTAKADRKYLSKTINLAQRVNDGQKIYIPFEDEALSVIDQGLIDLNSATLAQLDSLPGIGPVTAQKIIAGRPYQSISNFIETHLVTNTIWEKIKDQVTVR